MPSQVLVLVGLLLITSLEVLAILHYGLQTFFQSHARTHLGGRTVARLNGFFLGDCVWLRVVFGLKIKAKDKPRL